MWSEEELNAIRTASPEAQKSIMDFMGAGHSPEEVKAFAMQTINQSSVTAEADLLVGNDGQVAAALAASGIDNQEQVQTAAAEFALIAQQAIQNGQPLSEVRFADPNLSQEAIAAIYEQVAVKSGTSSAEIERKAEEAKKAEMDMIRGAVFGAAGQGKGGAGLLGEVVEAAAGRGGAVAGEESLAAGGQLPYKDMGDTFQAIADMVNGFTPGPPGLPGPGLDKGIGAALG